MNTSETLYVVGAGAVLLWLISQNGSPNRNAGTRRLGRFQVSINPPSYFPRQDFPNHPYAPPRVPAGELSPAYSVNAPDPVAIDPSGSVSQGVIDNVYGTFVPQMVYRGGHPEEV